MNNFERWALRRIAKRAVIQGDHKSRITEYYQIIIRAARNEFTEDNGPTLNNFLTECHAQAVEREGEYGVWPVKEK